MNKSEKDNKNHTVTNAGKIKNAELKREFESYAEIETEKMSKDMN